MNNYYKKFLYSPVTVISILVLILFFPLFLNKTLYFRDISMQDFPLTDFVSNSINHLEFPLWNPYMFCGFPQMASLQPPLFYPFTFFYYLFPFNIAMGLFLLIHYVISGYGVYLIGKYFKLNKVSSLLGGIVFALNSFMFELNSLQFMLIAISWFPFIFLSIEKLLDEKNNKNFVNLTIFLMLQVSTGRLDFVYFSLFIVFLQISYRLFKDKDYKNISIKTIFIGISVLVAVSSLAIQVLPSLEFVQSTKRGTGISIETATMFSLNPKQLIMFLFNNIFGDTFYNRGISPLASSDIAFFIYNIYVGFVVLVLSLFALINKVSKSRFIGFIFLLFIVLSFGKFTPIYEFLHNYLFGFNMVRFPIKLLIFSIFALSILSSMGLQSLLDRFPEDENSTDKNSINIKSIYVICLSSILVVFNVIVGFILFNKDAINYFNEGLKQYNLSVDNISFISNSLVSSFTIILIFTFLLHLAKSQKITKTYLGLAIIFLVSFDLLNVNLANLWVVDTENIYRKVDLANDIDSKIEDKKLYRIIKPLETTTPLIGKSKKVSDLINNMETLNSNIAMKYRFMDAYGYYPSEPSKINPLFNILNTYNENISSKEHSKIMKMLGVRFYIWHTQNKSIPSPDPNYFTLLKSYENTTQLWEVKDFRSRFNFKTNVFKASNDEEILDAILNPNKYNIDANTVILIGDNLESNFNPSYSLVETQIKLLSETNNTLTLEVNASSDGFVVISNTYDKGWKALVDDKESEVFKANFYQQAVKITKGLHQIKLEYKPYSFVLGSYISMFSFSGFLLFILFVRRKK